MAKIVPSPSGRHNPTWKPWKDDIFKRRIFHSEKFQILILCILFFTEKKLWMFSVCILNNRYTFHANIFFLCVNVLRHALFYQENKYKIDFPFQSKFSFFSIQYNNILAAFRQSRPCKWQIFNSHFLVHFFFFFQNLRLYRKNTRGFLLPWSTRTRSCAWVCNTPILSSHVLSSSLSGPVWSYPVLTCT